MDPNTNVVSFLKEIQLYGNQKPIRIRHKKELYKDLQDYIKKDNRFTVFSNVDDLDIIVRFNGKVFWHVENVENIRYGILLTFNSFDISCHKVKLVMVSVKNKIEIDIRIDEIKNTRYLVSLRSFSASRPRISLRLGLSFVA